MQNDKLPSARDRKENVAKDFLLSDPVDEGLICVIKTLESCRTAKVVGSKGKHFLKSSQTKCRHYYLYYLDKEFGFMFVKIQTWFPFNIQVCRRLDVFARSISPFGCRVKCKLRTNSVKIYDKCSVLRIETTINDPHEFKVFGTVRHHDGTESNQWKPMGKSISNLYRYAEVSKVCNQRLIDAMTDVVPVRSIQRFPARDDTMSLQKADGLWELLLNCTISTIRNLQQKQHKYS